MIENGDLENPTMAKEKNYKTKNLQG